MSPAHEPAESVAPGVRVLTPVDLVTMHALLELFGEAFEEPDTYGAARPQAAYLERLLASETFLALVAEVEGVVVGGLAAYELRKFERARSEIYIYDLAVSAEHRRRGVATALIERLRDIASERGAWVMFVQADPVDAPAVALYQKLGVREEVLHFDIAVPERPGPAAGERGERGEGRG
jgi:aminoglycoside 3-N-acetyltransferase I